MMTVNIIAKSRFLVEGKRCCIWENGRYGGMLKKYEVFEFNKDGMALLFDDDTPGYKKYGWDTLEEAKIFFLLQEI